MIKTKFLSFILASALVSPVLADRHLDAAVDFVNTYNTQEKIKKAAMGITEQIFIRVPAEKQDKKPEIYQIWFDLLSSRELAAVSAGPYKEQFSESELRQMTAFLKTSFGKKVFENILQAMAESEKVTKIYSQSRTAELFEKMKSVLKK